MTGSSLLLHLEALHENGMCLTLPSSTMTGFLDLTNYWLDALKKKETSPQMETTLLPSLLMLRGRTMLIQEDKVKGSSWDSKKEEKEDSSIATGLDIFLESVLTRRILQEMMTTITTTTRAMGIKGATGSTTKERGMLPLLEMEMVILPRS